LLRLQGSVEITGSAGFTSRSSSTTSRFGYFRLSVVLVFEVFDKAGEDEAQGILVVPDWLGSVMVREIKYCKQLELMARWPGGQETR
jgi:hypothetical protein